MFGNKEYVGLTIQDNVIRVARVMVDGKNLKLVKLDRFSLVEKLKAEAPLHELEGEDESFSLEEDEDADSIFGLEEDEEEDLEDIDFDDLEDLEEEEDDFALDMVEESESESAQSNELLLYNVLSGIDSNKLNLGLNIPAGHTIFQVIRETDFNEVKKKDLVQNLEDKLESIYGMPKSQDNYSYEIREDGSLLLASVDDESVTLELTDQARELYGGKISIQNVIPDEIAVVGLVRANYELAPEEMTAIIQFGKESCRVVFMKGKEIWLVSPVINEGTDDKSFLNTVFSKILFQLDTGEVPSLDRILLANNTIGDSAVEFFTDNFPDIKVENISYKSDLFDFENVDPASMPGFTTTIGVALASSGVVDEHFPKLSFLPKRVVDRQKIFQLQWHGVLILLLIFLTPITFNYFYNQNVQEIESLSNELNQLNTQIEKITPTVNSANELSENLSTLREKLVLLDTLAQGTREWTAKFDILNQGISNVGSSWITSLSESEENILIQGYSLYRSRIPRIVKIFEEATLLSVENEMMREEKQVYNFSISVKKFTQSDSLYSPSTPEEVENLISNSN